MSYTEMDTAARTHPRMRDNKEPLLKDNNRKARRGHDQAQARVLQVSILAAMVGMVIILIGTYIKDPTGGFALVGGVLAVAAVLAATTADLDVNAFLTHKQWIFALTLFVYLLLCAFLGIIWHDFWIAWVMSLPLLYAVIRFMHIVRLTPGFPLPTEIITSFLAFGAFGFGCNYLARLPIDWTTFHFNGDQQWVAPPIAVASTYFAGAPFCVLVHYLSWRRGDTPTVRMYMSLYAWLITEGTAAIVEDACSRTIGYHNDQFSAKRRPLDILNGPSYFLLPALMMCFRSRLHGKLGRMWARQRMRDGAEIACLLERASNMECGMHYWLHRPDICDEPGCLDLKCGHLKCSTHHQACECQIATSGPWPRWVKGEIVAVEEDSFTVQVGTMNKLAIVPADCEGMGASPRGETLTLTVRKKFVLKVELSAKEILKEGGAQLQCVRAGLITYERLSQGSGKSNIDELAEKGVPGDVDFFVSHSWHDDKETKFHQWEEFFGAFKRAHHRDAKCWLDEIIINQGNIEDSLKCLPVYLMACKKVLVLCGDTYCDRLWCIWELYTLFAFSDYWEDALNRVHIIDLAKNGSIASKLQQFNLDDARCYNPNDQNKIRDAIETGPGGVERFTELVQKIGRDLAGR
jgi:hypothetical protein